MKAALTVVCVFALMVTVNAKAFGQSATADKRGEHLYHACKAAVKTMDDNASIAPNDYADANYCLGYVEGFTDSHAWSETPSQSFCLDASLGVIIRVYVQYMEHNPTLLDAPNFIGFNAALHQNYPCHTAIPK